MTDPQLGLKGPQSERVEMDPHQPRLQDSTVIQENVTITLDVIYNHITYNSPQPPGTHEGSAYIVNKLRKPPWQPWPLSPTTVQIRLNKRLML